MVSMAPIAELRMVVSQQKYSSGRILVLHSGDNRFLDSEELRFFYERKQRYAIIQGVI